MLRTKSTCARPTWRASGTVGSNSSIVNPGPSNRANSSPPNKPGLAFFTHQTSLIEAT